MDAPARLFGSDPGPVALGLGWLAALQALLGGASPSSGAPSGPPDLARQFLDPLFAAGLQALGARAGGTGGTGETGETGNGENGEDARAALVGVVQERASQLARTLGGLAQALASPAGAAGPGGGLAGVLLAQLERAMEPHRLALERTHGGLADALGLAPLREFTQATQALAQAAREQQQAQGRLLGLLAEALRRGSAALPLRVAATDPTQAPVQTLQALVREWARATDEAVHEGLQSPAGVQAVADLLRSAARLRQQQQRLVGVASEALDIPTRADMDEAFREIQELKRALRRAQDTSSRTEPRTEPRTDPRTDPRSEAPARQTPARKTPARRRARPQEDRTP